MGRSPARGSRMISRAWSVRLGRHTETAKLLPFEADPDPGLKAAARDDVDRRDILGQTDRIAKRHQEHARRDADTLGSGRYCGCRGEDRGQISIVDELVRQFRERPPMLGSLTYRIVAKRRACVDGPLGCEGKARESCRCGRSCIRPVCAAVRLVQMGSAIPS